MRVNLGRIEKKSFDKNLNGKFKKLNNGMFRKWKWLVRFSLKKKK
jgi:hypothetical protein